jgi:hypothetical protein
MTRDQQQGALSEAQYNYENRRANLSIAYNTAAGRLKNVQDAIQLKTKALDDRWNRNIQSYQLMADAIQNDLTESEKLIVQANLSKKQADANAIRDTYSSVLAQVAQNGAPSYILDAIDAAASKPNATEADIRNAAGSYGVDRLQQAQLAKAQADLVKQNLIANLTTDQASDPFIQKLLNTAGGKPLTDTFAQQLNKGLTVLGQVGVLQNNVQDVKTGPIIGLFKGANPWDTNAQTIKAQLNAIVPNLARGVYGEVGVLTDNDIKTYASTLPNLKSTEDVRNAVLGITVDLIGKNVKRILEVNAANGKDVSGFVDIYTEMQNTRDSIFSQIPGYKGAQNGSVSNLSNEDLLSKMNSVIDSGKDLNNVDFFNQL